MFCPNCGTQNTDTAQACVKCNFNLKGGGAAPKFKGTMLMVNQAGAGAPAAPAAPARPAAPAAPAPPSKLKGTMVGVAPPVAGSAPIAPQGPDAQFGSSAVNPLGGTMTADVPPPFGAGNADPFGATNAASGGDQWGAPPPAAPAQDQWGAPPPAAPAQDQWGAPAAPAGDPQGQYGQPPPPQQQQWGAPQDQQQQWGGGAAGYGAPPQPQGMVPYQQQQQGMVAPGGNGPKGQIRSPMTVLLMHFIPFYGLIHLFTTAGEVNGFLRKPAMSPVTLILLSMLTCGLYAMYWQVAVVGGIIFEVQQRAGVPNPQNQGFMYIIPIYNVYLMQEELNKAWQMPG